MGHHSLREIAEVYDRVGKVRERKEVVEYRLPDGTFPGEAVLRKILGDARIEALLYGGTAGDEAGRPLLRLVR